MLLLILIKWFILMKYPSLLNTLFYLFQLCNIFLDMGTFISLIFSLIRIKKVEATEYLMLGEK
jgi:hypothetical protein